MSLREDERPFHSAYITRSVTSSKTEVSEGALLLRNIKDGIESLHGTEKAQLDVLLRLEKIALEVKNESGDVLALQRGPRASAQVIGANNPGRLIGEAMIHGLCGSPNTDQSLWTLASNVKCSLDNYHGPVHASLYITSMYFDVGIAGCTSLVASIVMR